MVSLTRNEAKTIEFLVRNFSSEFNINQLSRELGISPGGMFKILKKLSEKKYVAENKRGNNVFYDINYDFRDVLDVCKFVLTEKEDNERVDSIIKDLDVLDDKVDMLVVFGSMLEKASGEISVLVVPGEGNSKEVDETIDKINELRKVKIKKLVFTKEDFAANLKSDEVLEAIKSGVFVFGRDVLMEVIKNEKNE